MDALNGRRLVRAARALLRWEVADFAAALGVGEATIKRIESDVAVRDETLRVVLARLKDVGILVLEADIGRGIAGGIAFTSTALSDAPRPRPKPKPLARGDGDA